jgi:hypothetical protein
MHEREHYYSSEIDGMDVNVSSEAFQRTHTLREVTIGELLQAIWATMPYEPCEICGHRVHLTDGLCYPCQLRQSKEFQEHMQQWEQLYGKGGVPCDVEWNVPMND